MPLCGVCACVRVVYAYVCVGIYAGMHVCVCARSVCVWYIYMHAIYTYVLCLVYVCNAHASIHASIGMQVGMHVYQLYIFYVYKHTHIYIYVYIYICIYVHIHTYIYHMYLAVYACAHPQTRARTHAHTHARAPTYSGAEPNPNTCTMQQCIHVGTCLNTHTHMHTTFGAEPNPDTRVRACVRAGAHAFAHLCACARVCVFARGCAACVEGRELQGWGGARGRRKSFSVGWIL